MLHSCQCTPRGHDGSGLRTRIFTYVRFVLRITLVLSMKRRGQNDFGKCISLKFRYIACSAKCDVASPMGCTDRMLRYIEDFGKSSFDKPGAHCISTTANTGIWSTHGVMPPIVHDFHDFCVAVILQAEIGSALGKHYAMAENRRNVTIDSHGTKVGVQKHSHLWLLNVHPPQEYG